MANTRPDEQPIDDNIWIALRRVLGHTGVANLRKGLGGADFKVPIRVEALHSAHPLVTALGQESAKLMVREFAGEQFYVRLEIPDPSVRYIRAVDDGLSNREIARSFGVSERQVRRMLRIAGVQNHNRPQTPRRRALTYVGEDEAMAYAAE